MATIQIKRSTGTSAPSSLAAGELAVTLGTGTAGNLGDRLFIGDGTTVNVIGGKFFSDMLDHDLGTLTASSALTVDSNSAVDDLNVGNNATTGGSIQLKEGTNNGAHHVQLKSPNSLSASVSFTLPDADGTASGQVLKTNGSGTLSFAAVATSELSGTISNAQLAGSIANSKLSNSTISIDADSGTTNAVDLGDTLQVAGGEGIDTTVSGDTLTIAGEDASDSNKGIASFDATDFSVSSGDVTLNAERIQDIVGAMTTGNTETNITVAYEDSDGTIDFSLNNTSVTAGSYGSATAIPTFTVDAQGRLTAAGTASISSTLDIAADSGTDDGVALGTDTLTISGGTGIATSVSGDTITIAGTNASGTDKGIASFAAADFSVSSGAVSIKNLGVSNAQLAGSIALSKLATTTASRALVSSGTGVISASAVTATELAILDGGTSATTTTLEDADRIVVNDDGTMVQVALTDFETYFESALDTLSNVTTVGALNAGSITSGFGSIDTGSSTITTTGNLTGGTVIAGDGTGAATVKSNGNHDLQLKSGNSTTGSITITDGANGDITIAPNGTATVKVPSGYKDRSGFTANSLATKEYVDAVKTGLDIKDSVKVATTAAGTLSSSFANNQTVDGITLATGDRILIKDQSTGSENGIYTVNASGAPTRATDFDEDAEVSGGAFTFVEQGNANGDSGFVLTNNGTVDVGTDAMSFTKFSGAGSITAGAGLGESGTTFSVNVDNSSIEINSDTLRVKAGGITNSMIDAATINLTQKVTGTLPTGNGGTGLASYTAGDMVYYASGTALEKLGIGASGTFLTSDGTAPSWTNTIDGGQF